MTVFENVLVAAQQGAQARGQGSYALAPRLILLDEFSVRRRPSMPTLSFRMHTRAICL